MNHWQEMGEGGDVWLEQQMAEPVGTPLSVVPPTSRWKCTLIPGVVAAGRGAGPAFRY